MEKRAMDRKQKLYRKVNTRARGVHHDTGGDYAHQRGTKRERDSQLTRGPMGTRRRGLDYTPLFRFLLSRVGEDWDGVYAEAVARLDRPEPIFWMVARTPDERVPYFRSGESSYFRGLYIDEENRLAVVDPELSPERMTPSCACCTHTLDGVRFS
jgi:hypothetical protein